MTLHGLSGLVKSHHSVNTNLHGHLYCYCVWIVLECGYNIKQLTDGFQLGMIFANLAHTAYIAPLQSLKNLGYSLCAVHVFLLFAMHGF